VGSLVFATSFAGGLRIIDIDGEPAPYEAWAIYFGEASGALDWRVLDRLTRSVDAAKVLLRLSGAGKQQHIRAA